MKITMLTTSAELLLKMIPVYRYFEVKHAGVLDLTLIHWKPEPFSHLKETMEQAILESDVLLLDVDHGFVNLRFPLPKVLSSYQSEVIPLGNGGRSYLKWKGLTGESLSCSTELEPEQTDDLTSLLYLQQCRKKGDQQALLEMLYLILGEWIGDKLRLPKDRMKRSLLEAACDRVSDMPLS